MEIRTASRKERPKAMFRGNNVNKEKQIQVECS